MSSREQSIDEKAGPDCEGPSDQDIAGRPPHWNLSSVVAGLKLSRDVSHNIRHRGRLRPPPSREAVVKAVQGFAAALFPAHYGDPGLTSETIDYYVGATLNEALTNLCEQVARSLPFSVQEDRSERAFRTEAADITRSFAAALPEIRGLLVHDLRAAYDGDPAATGYSEILLVYPGMAAILHHRIAHALHRLGATFLARFVSDIAHSRTGIDIHPGAAIGESFFIDHGTGVVIGETAVIGRRVRLYQAVTLGAKSFPADERGVLVKGNPRHPIIEDDVVIYAGATVLGRITIGRGSSIGGNVWLTHSVPPGSHITQAQNRSGERPERDP
ncbi:serine acetyltransferase [Ancylobacter sp. Lp-2]|uniref:serine O-acetyltransferase EpsC n=1 Tax=Ancylobacter sp. Lp-2 TaxID=2881339 RepID=UPI001E418829|nr:serine O-acetyltransferase EpsC [Ancylobacter sp. Lp-2]MCB4770450.1 serine acetyltransferase [Ancylobacter sp. Lp-2]